MHSQLHVEFQRATAGGIDRKHAVRSQASRLRPKAPPGRLRARLASTLFDSALRLDRDVMWRTVR